MYQITITKIEDKDTAFAVKYGCKTYAYHTVSALIDELESYLLLAHDDEQRNRDQVMDRASRSYSSTKEEVMAIGPAYGTGPAETADQELRKLTEIQRRRDNFSQDSVCGAATPRATERVNPVIKRSHKKKVR